MNHLIQLNFLWHFNIYITKVFSKIIDQFMLVFWVCKILSQGYSYASATYATFYMCTELIFQKFVYMVTDGYLNLFLNKSDIILNQMVKKKTEIYNLQSIKIISFTELKFVMQMWFIWMEATAYNKYNLPLKIEKVQLN